MRLRWLFVLCQTSGFPGISPVGSSVLLTSGACGARQHSSWRAWQAAGRAWPSGALGQYCVLRSKPCSANRGSISEMRRFGRRSERMRSFKWTLECIRARTAWRMQLVKPQNLQRACDQDGRRRSTSAVEFTTSLEFFIVTRKNRGTRDTSGITQFDAVCASPRSFLTWGKVLGHERRGMDGMAGTKRKELQSAQQESAVDHVMMRSRYKPLDVRYTDVSAILSSLVVGS